MLEESVDNFILQHRSYASPVEVLPRTEGSPLLEIVIGTTVVHLLERTNPYAARPGRQHVIINPTALSFAAAPEPRKALEVLGLSRIRASGLVLERSGNVVIMDAGAVLVVSFPGDLPDSVSPGEWQVFESSAPIHGFVLPAPQQQATGRRTDEL